MSTEILEYFGKKKGPKKAYKFYKSLIRENRHDPDLVKKLIDEVPKWGYWKDLLIVMCMCKKNQQLTDYIYDIIITQLNKDIDAYKKNEELSTLAKWMPREGSQFDVKLNFVTTISKKLYPQCQSFSAKKIYRKSVSELSAKLNVTERHLCAKEFDKIEFKNVPKLCLQRYTNTFLKHDVTKDKLKIFLEEKYAKLSLPRLVGMIAGKTVTQFEADIINTVFKNKHDAYIEYNQKKYDVDFNTLIILLDLNQDIITNNMLNLALGLGIIGKNVYVNGRIPHKLVLNDDNNFIDKVSSIYRRIDSHRDIVLDQFRDVADISTRKIMIITGRDLEETEIPDSDNYIIINKKKRDIKTKKYKVIEKIIVDDIQEKEANRTTPVPWLAGLLLILFMLKIYQYIITGIV